jgi:hypothetical protein
MNEVFFNVKLFEKKMNQIVRWICLREVDVGLLVCIYFERSCPNLKAHSTPIAQLFKKVKVLF